MYGARVVFSLIEYLTRLFEAVRSLVNTVVLLYSQWPHSPLGDKTPKQGQRFTYSYRLRPSRLEPGSPLRSLSLVRLPALQSSLSLPAMNCFMGNIPYAVGERAQRRDLRQIAKPGESFEYSNRVIVLQLGPWRIVIRNATIGSICRWMFLPLGRLTQKRMTNFLNSTSYGRHWI